MCLLCFYFVLLSLFYVRRWLCNLWFYCFGRLFSGILGFGAGTNLRFFAPKTWFPHENIAISRSSFRWVSRSLLGINLGVFWGLSGAPLGATQNPSGPQLRDFAASWVSWVASLKPRGIHVGFSWVTFRSLRCPVGFPLANMIVILAYLAWNCSFYCLPWRPLLGFNTDMVQAGVGLSKITDMCLHILW